MTKLLVKLFVKESNDVNNPLVRSRYGFLAGITGIVLNILLFSGKLLSGVITGAISIVADAFNNLSDAGSSIITLLGFKMAGMPADKEHPFGHGRLEYVASLIVSLFIMLMGFELAKSSIEKVQSPTETTFSVLSIVILSVSVLVKLWMFFFNRKLSKIISSEVMKATAMDSISDVVATLSVIVGAVFTLITNIQIDGYIGIAVACFIFFTGIKTARDSLSPLLGQMPDKALVDDIKKTVLSYNGIVGVHDLIIHNYGVGVCIISLHAEIPCTMDIVKAHELIDVIEEDLKIKYRSNPTIHMDPIATDDEETNLIKSKVETMVDALDPQMSIHDFRIIKGTYHYNIIFDVVVPFKFRLNDEEVVSTIRKAVGCLDDRYFAVVNVDKGQ